MIKVYKKHQINQLVVKKKNDNTVEGSCDLENWNSDF